MSQAVQATETAWRHLSGLAPRRRRPRVLQIVTKADLGGAQVHVLDLLRGLQDDFELSLAVGEEGYCTEQAREMGIECHVLPGLVQKMDPLSDLKALVSTLRALRRIQPDLVHCHTTKAGLIGRLAAALSKVPAIYTVHTWCFTEGTSRSWKAVGLPAETLAARWARCIIAVSDSNRTAAIRKRVAPAAKLITVHNGIGDVTERARPGDDSTPRIVMVARFAAQKNQALLIEAVSRLESPTILTLVGDGPLRAEAEQLAQKCPAHIKIEFLGQRRDIGAILAGAHLFALSTNWEGFPISILEALRAGLPVIASDVDGVRESVYDGDNGVLIPPRDADALTGALRRLLGDPVLRQRMGARGRTIYEERFSLPAMLRKTSAVYDLALGRPHDTKARRVFDEEKST
jgi:glycosyltransferase involved in cell wall biosynthesis